MLLWYSNVHSLLFGMQGHISAKQHIKAQNQKKCVEGIKVKRHHFSWDNIQLEDEESKDKQPIQTDKTPSAHDILKRSVKCIADDKESNQKASKSKDSTANPIGADVAKPRPGHNKAEQKLQPVQYKDALLKGLRCH